MTDNLIWTEKSKETGRLSEETITETKRIKKKVFETRKFRMNSD